MKETPPSQKHQSVAPMGFDCGSDESCQHYHEVMSNFRCSGRSEEPTQVRDSV
jgi:hypothetical protein